MSPILPDRESIFPISIEGLRDILRNESEERVSRFLDHILNVEWLEQIEVQKIEDLFIKVCCSAKPSNTKKIIRLFQERTPKNSRPSDDFEKRSAETIFQHNPRFLKEMMFNQYRLGGWTEEQQHLGALSEAYKLNIRPIVDDLLKTPPLDCKAPNHENIFSIVFRYGTFDDVKRVLELYRQTKGEDAFRERVKESSYDFRRFLANQDCDRLRLLIATLKEYDLDPVDLLFSSCETMEMVDVLFGGVPEEKVQETLKEKGVQQLFTMLEKPTEEFEPFLSLLEKNGHSLHDLFKELEQHEMTLLDVACLNGRAKHVKILLALMCDEVKSALLFRRNYGRRRPAEHSIYYFPQSGCLELIKPEMIQLLATSLRENRQTRNPFYAAFDQSDTAEDVCALFKELITQGEAIENVEGLVMRAACFPDPDRHQLIKLLLDAGLEPDGNVLFPLIGREDTQSLKFLLNRKVSIYVTSSAPDKQDGYTWLHEAALFGSEKIVRFLLESGFDPHAKATNGMTPALLAKRCKNKEVQDLLGSSELKENPEDIIPLHINRTVVIATGVSSNGEQVVLVNKEGKLPEEYKRFSDPTFEAVCARILEEEHPRAQKVHCFSSVSKDHMRKYTTEFYQVDLGEALSSFENRFIGSQPTCNSAKLVLKGDFQALDHALTVEYEWRELLIEEINNENIDGIAALLKHTSMQEVLDRNSLGVLMEKAVKKKPALMVPFWEFAKENGVKIKSQVLVDLATPLIESGAHEQFQWVFDELFINRAEKFSEEEKQLTMFDLICKGAELGDLHVREHIHPHIEWSNQKLSEEASVAAESGQKEYLDVVLEEMKGNNYVYNKALKKALKAATSFKEFPLAKVIAKRHLDEKLAGRTDFELTLSNVKALFEDEPYAEMVYKALTTLKSDE